MNQTVCAPCKAALDVISRQAKAQGESQWFARVREEPAKLKALVDSYQSCQKEARDAGRKKAKFSVVTVREELESKSEAQNRGRDQKMWRGQAIKHWTSVDGGDYTQEEAEQFWKDVCRVA